MNKSMFSFDEVTQFINQGKTLILAAHENLLSKLPDGNWLGGTIPYFMGDEGGLFSENLIHVVDFTDELTDFNLKFYAVNELEHITVSAYSNGFNFVILPALKKVHLEFALKAPTFKNLFLNPLLGWVAGVEFNDVGKVAPKVFVGNKSSEEMAAVMHASISKEKVARIETVNVYEQGEGDEIVFPESGFDASRCIVNGEEQLFTNYIEAQGSGDRLPLVANYAGAMVNVGFRIYKEEKRVELYAPVFKNTIYKLANQVHDYESVFREKLNTKSKIHFACNCLMNYFNFKLDGQKIENINGPITYGEIGYQLLNQTFVYLIIESRY